MTAEKGANAQRYNMVEVLARELNADIAGILTERLMEEELTRYREKLEPVIAQKVAELTLNVVRHNNAENMREELVLYLDFRGERVEVDSGTE